MADFLFESVHRTYVTRHETDSQPSVNNIWSCILGNQGFGWINEFITELLTVSIAQNAKYKRENTHSKIINVANCKI
jgi:hypothetical protein